jgi:hypothetical protein
MARLSCPPPDLVHRRQLLAQQLLLQLPSPLPLEATRSQTLQARSCLRSTFVRGNPDVKGGLANIAGLSFYFLTRIDVF